MPRWAWGQLPPDLELTPALELTPKKEPRGREIELTRPLLAAPALTWYLDTIPATWEWAYWISSGISRTTSKTWGATAGLGFELTVGVATYRGFPAGRCLPRSTRFGEVRIGPWGSAGIRGEGGLVEAGLKVHLGGLYQASFGTFDLRVGSGYGAFDEGHYPHASVTFTWGVRSAIGRYHRNAFGKPQALRERLASTSVVRFQITHREALSIAGSETLFGLEISPSFFLLPLTWPRIWGGPPW